MGYVNAAIMEDLALHYRGDIVILAGDVSGIKNEPKPEATLTPLLSHLIALMEWAGVQGAG